MKRLASENEPFLEAVVVLDHAVVHDRDMPRLVEVRVRIDIARRTMGRPASVPDPAAPRHWLGGQERCKPFLDLALALPDNERFGFQQCYPGTVITPVFQPAQAFEKDGACEPAAHVTDDSAHV